MKNNIKMNKLTGIKDLDLYILQNLDDRSMLNFLAASKDLYTDENIAFIFGKRYPELLKFKRPDETLKSLYLRMLKYIGLLREKYGFVYRIGNPVLLYAFKKYDIVDEGVDSLLIQAIMKKDLEVVKTSVEAGADVNAYDTASLRWASEGGYLPIVKYLVERGADIHSNDYAGLIWADYYGHSHVVKYLESVIKNKK